jgi:hypothetical protein
MFGEVASIIQDNKQIGGLFDWTIQLVEEKGSKNGWVSNKPHKVFSAKYYWLLEIPKSNEFEIKFYQIAGNDLCFVSREKVKLNFPSLELDKKLSDIEFV